MEKNITGRRFFCQIVIWTLAAITGLTVTLIAVGLLGLWVLIGAFAGLGTTLVMGWVLALLFCTDLDALAAAKRGKVTGSDNLS